MFNIVLYQPEIPPNTGSIMRLCANTGCSLHLIEPLGFELDDKRLRRAGMDYKERANINLYQQLPDFIEKQQPNKVFLCTTKAKQYYTDATFQPNDALVFGPETRGLPSEILDSYPEIQLIKIPMQSTGRSLNLATAVAIIAYEAWRQQGFS